jgi:hypothetical protein
MDKPIILIIRNKKGVPVKEYKRYTFRRDVLAKAARIGNQPGQPKDDEIASFVVDAFGNRFTIKELKAGCSTADICQVFEHIVDLAVPNKPKPAPPELPAPPIPEKDLEKPPKK